MSSRRKMSISANPHVIASGRKSKNRKNVSQKVVATISFSPSVENRLDTGLRADRELHPVGMIRAVLHGAAPTAQHVMDGSGPDQRRIWGGEPARMEDEGRGLSSTEPAVERDQLLESAAFLELGIVEAVDENVGGVLESVGPEQMSRRIGSKWLEWIVTLDDMLFQIVLA